MVAGKTMILISITLLMCIIDQAVGINCKCASNGLPLYNGNKSYSFSVLNN